MNFIINWILRLFREEKPGEVVTVEVEETPKAEPAPVKKAEPKPKKEAPAKPKITKTALNKMTKAQLEEKGREIGLELDKRKKKADLVNELYAQLK